MKNLLLGAAILACTTSANAATTVGTYSSNNCIPFACSESFDITTYQQVYSAGAFSGLTQIDTFSIFRDTNFGNDTEAFTFDISFYLTSAAVNGLSTTGADNLGTLLSTFGSFGLSGSVPDKLSFSGNAFYYDPTQGNLLLQFSQTSVTTGIFSDSSFQSDVSGSATSRYYASGGSATGFADTNAIVTEFDFVGVGAVPEPATWAFMIFGFGAIGGALRSNRRGQRKANVKVSYA